MPPDSLATPIPQTPWEFSASGLYYAFPYDDDDIELKASADHEDLHFEARYNYEDSRTASVFAGYTFSIGESATVSLTPMAGVAFGRTTGIVSALEASLGYGVLDFYAESEYLFDVYDKMGNFFYSWLEFGVTPASFFRTGIVTQWTKTVEASLEVNRGPFVQLLSDPGMVSVYAFNLFADSWLMAVEIAVAW